VRLRRLRSGTLPAVSLRRPGPPTVNCTDPGCDLSGVEHRHLALQPAAEEPPRPHPAANAWPDDAVTVTYAELRRLVALHLELCSATMPRDKPWDWMRMRAGAVRDGETPLLLSEVMDP
jgi:hypothetical protein